MFLRGVASRSAIIGWIAAILVLATMQTSESAPVILNSSIGTGCQTIFSNPYLEANRYFAASNVTIGAINFLIGNQSTTNFSTSRLYIFSDSATVNKPYTILSTFTPDVVSGSGSMTTGRFVGSQSIAAGTKFWVVPSVRASVLPWCYWTAVTTANMTLNGISPDTSTSLDNSLFRKIYSASVSPPNPGSWDYSGDAAQIWQLSFEAGVNAISASLAISGGTRIANYRATTTINATVNASAKVTFYAGKKVIANCRNIASAGGVASCNWQPSVIGTNIISARAVSLDSSFSDNTAPSLEVMVVARSNTR